MIATARKRKRISGVIAELREVLERHGDLVVDVLVLEYRDRYRRVRIAPRESWPVCGVCDLQAFGCDREGCPMPNKLVLE